ncbi:MAG: transposase-like zinc-binding domain-containing protein [Nitrospirota bacterium]
MMITPDAVADQRGENSTHEICCPYCTADVTYKYGRIHTGKQRFLCLMCGKQFTIGRKKTEFPDKPLCPACGKIMHVYKREDAVMRFRCSGYPECRMYQKIPIGKGAMRELLHA